MATRVPSGLNVAALISGLFSGDWPRVFPVCTSRKSICRPFSSPNSAMAVRKSGLTATHARVLFRPADRLPQRAIRGIPDPGHPIVAHREHLASILMKKDSAHAILVGQGEIPDLSSFTPPKTRRGRESCWCRDSIMKYPGDRAAPPTGCPLRSKVRIMPGETSVGGRHGVRRPP